MTTPDPAIMRAAYLELDRAARALSAERDGMGAIRLLALAGEIRRMVSIEVPA